jgi:hypothetical protein
MQTSVLVAGVVHLTLDLSVVFFYVKNSINLSTCHYRYVKLCPLVGGESVRE